MWRREATLYELLEAWAQRAHTDRQLVRALNLAAIDCGHRIRKINKWASRTPSLGWRPRTSAA